MFPRWLGVFGLAAATVYSLAHGELLATVIPGFPTWGLAGLVGSLCWLVRLLLPLMGLFVPSLRGLEENLYIAYEPYIVDHSKYAHAFGDHATPLHEAIGETVRWYQAHSAQQLERHTAPDAAIVP